MANKLITLQTPRIQSSIHGSLCKSTSKRFYQEEDQALAQHFMHNEQQYKNNVEVVRL